MSLERGKRGKHGDGGSCGPGVSGRLATGCGDVTPRVASPGVANLVSKLGQIGPKREKSGTF